MEINLSSARKKDQNIMHRIFTFLFLIFLIFSGCSLLQVREDANILQKSIALVGTISSPTSSNDIPVIVAAYSEEDGRKVIAHYTTLHESGPYELMVPVGVHNIIAFEDKNKNLTYDMGEPAGEILNAEQASNPAGGVSGNLDIVISEQNNNKTYFPIGYKLQPKKYKKFHSTSPGAIADLDEFVFSGEFGKKGLWNGLEFYDEIGGNVYFLEEYDSNKVPILFVHGAGGSPQDWKAFFNGIDRSRYQPWFYYYPSGSSLDSMSHLLLWKIQNLQMKYKFKELYITAHSMGGLVVRSFLVNYGHLFPSITNFISISTPWGGEELAELGVKYSPGVIPAWRDMQPGSEFIKSIFRKKISPVVDYYLFFGHRGNRNILRPNNDKAVTLASQLDQRSQQDAKMIYGFDEDHVSILSSKQVLSQYNAILTDISEKSGALDKSPGNRLHVEFSFDLPENQPRPVSALYLRPLDEKGAETWIYLRPEDSDQVHGPFSAGNYEASVIADAFIPEPVKIPVSIEKGIIPKIRFTMKPVGYLRGYVAKSDQPFTQAGNEAKPDAEVAIQSVTLRGNGINRTLIPLQVKNKDYNELSPEYYLSGTDFTFQGTFFFFRLPAGNYELLINAKGYKPYSGKYDVTPGQYQNTIRVKLQKEKLE